MTTIDLLQPGSVDKAAVALGRAFHSDPMFVWIFPDEAKRPAALHRLNRVPLVYGVRYGRVTTSHGAKAACVWIPPGQGVSMLRMIRSGALAVPVHIGLRATAKFVCANTTMEKIHKRGVPEPHWYLMIVGVDPGSQNQGVGSALLKEGLARADKEGRPCYLETSEERNVAFYERFGFSVLEQATLGAGGPPAWAMRRDPQHGSNATA